MWTRFSDMCSGGSVKLDWEYIFIEADEQRAKELFEEKFGRNPDHITCYCCGEDYSITQHESLEHLTGSYRHATWDYDTATYLGDGESLWEYEQRDDVKILRTKEKLISSRELI